MDIVCPLNHFTLQRHHGKRRVFTGVKRYMLNEMKDFIAKIKKGLAENQPLQASPEKLCPACFVPLEEKLTQCLQCNVGFKKPKTAFLKSLILPGWGDMYLGHRLLGSLELVGTAFVWFVVISAVTCGVSENLSFAVVIFIFYNLMDGLLTYHMAKKGYMQA